MITALIERGADPRDIAALGGKSAGTEIEISDGKFSVLSAEEFDFSRAECVFGATENDIARHFAPRITSAGAVFIDNSSAFRLCADVPLVIPEINPQDAFLHGGIISNPNCSTIIAAVAVSGINRLSKIVSMTVSTYQAVSGAGVGGIRELEAQNRAMLSGEEIKTDVFPYQIAGNVIPKIGGDAEGGYTAEEMKLQSEGRKIFHLPELTVSCTCVRVPVMRSHSISIEVKTERKISREDARTAIRESKGCILFDDLEKEKYPMPILSSGRDEVYVGRVRETPQGGLALFCCGDQLRKGAATNAVQIAEILGF